MDVMKTVISNGKVITPFQMMEKGSVVIENGVVVDIVEGDSPRYDGGVKVIDAARRFSPLSSGLLQSVQGT
jgi:dihydroorotase-like cyclic amidohydrolase